MKAELHRLNIPSKISVYKLCRHADNLVWHHQTEIYILIVRLILTSRQSGNTGAYLRRPNDHAHDIQRLPGLCGQGKLKVNNSLTLFANIWLGIAVLMNMLVIAGALVTSAGVWDGIGQVQDAYDPFDIRTWLFQIGLFAPAIVAICWRNLRANRPTD